MKRFIFLIVFISFSRVLFSQEDTPFQTKNYYERAFSTLNIFLERDTSVLFKDAVFVTENAFWRNQMRYEDYSGQIDIFTSIILEWIKSNHLVNYKMSDSTNLHLNYAIFTFLKDTIKLLGPNNEVYGHLPFTYEFSDFMGKKEWTNMFVTKLMATKSGNCHSLPYLYKILADELGASCWLSLAPNHVYIKNRSKRLGWYNTELTSGGFPVDAWITASGYIPIKAVQNGIYMDTLSNRQAIALCVLDLAKGYEFQTKNYVDGFILKCCDLVLKYHPTNVQAMLLKAEAMKRVYGCQRHEKKSDASNTFKEMEQLYAQLLDLGYREMPEEMYLNWLMSITNESKKYQNNKVLDAVK